MGESFESKFTLFWVREEPFGYDHPNTFDPIVNMFMEADNKIDELEAKLSHVEERRDFLQKVINSIEEL